MTADSENGDFSRALIDAGRTDGPSEDALARELARLGLGAGAAVAATVAATKISAGAASSAGVGAAKTAATAGSLKAGATLSLTAWTGKLVIGVAIVSSAGTAALVASHIDHPSTEVVAAPTTSPARPKASAGRKSVATVGRSPSEPLDTPPSELATSESLGADDDGEPSIVLTEPISGTAAAASATSATSILVVKQHVSNARQGSLPTIAGATEDQANLRTSKSSQGVRPSPKTVGQTSVTAHSDIAHSDDPRSDIAQEVSLLDRARAVATSAPSEALAALDEHARRFPRGTLADQATVVRIEALLTRGDRNSAVRVAEAYRQNHANSPLGRRMQSLLDATKDAGATP